MIIISRPKKYPIRLSDDDILQLQAVIENDNCSKTVRSRCRILLDLDSNHEKKLTHEQCAKANGISAATVTNIVRLYYNGGIEKVVTLNRNANSNNGGRRRINTNKGLEPEIACGSIGDLAWVLCLVKNFTQIELDIPALQRKNCWYI